jgi:hypothetical protein
MVFTAHKYYLSGPIKRVDWVENITLWGGGGEVAYRVSLGKTEVKSLF